MARRKVTLAYITNDAERKASFRKRKKGVINKVKEISTLCDVDACAIIYGPDETEPEVWPSKEGALAVLARFYSLPEYERSRKMVNHEEFTRMRSKKMRAQIDRLKKDNGRTEAANFIYRCWAGAANLGQLDMGRKAEVGWVVNQIMRDLAARIEEKKAERAGGASVSGAAWAGALEERPMEAAVPPVDEEAWDNLLRDVHTEPGWFKPGPGPEE